MTEENNDVNNSLIMKFDRDAKMACFLKLVNDSFLIPKFRNNLFPEMFSTKDETEPLQRLFSLVLNKNNKGEDVTFAGIYGWLQLSPDGKERESMISIYKEMREKPYLWELSRSDVFIKSFLSWIKMYRTYVGSKEVAGFYRTGDFDRAEKAQMRMESDNALINLDKIESIDFSKIKENISKSAANLLKSGLRIGIPDFDANGGFSQGTLSALAAPQGGGKGMFTTHLVRSAIFQKKYIYVAIVEDRPDLVYRRITSAMTGIPLNRLKTCGHELSPDEYSQIERVGKSMEEYAEIEMLFGWNYKAVLERFKLRQQQRQQEGLPPYDVFVFDYLAHAVRTEKADEGSRHESLHKAMSDLNDFTKINNLVTITYWQVTSSAKEKVSTGGLIEDYDISGSKAMMELVDTGISINRSLKNESANKAIFYFMKGREGNKSAKYEVSTDFSVARYEFGKHCLRLDKMPPPEQPTRAKK
jgi:KaiC/GvpD/RAD55 family RecA-like ATPase